MISGGLMALGGLGQGVAQGVNSYMQMRQLRNSEAERQQKAQQATQQLGLLARHEGFDIDPQTGAITPRKASDFQRGFLQKYGITPSDDVSETEAQGLIPKLAEEDSKLRIAREHNQTLKDIAGTKAGGSGIKDIQKLYPEIRKDKQWQRYSAQENEGGDLLNQVSQATVNPIAANALGVYAARYASGGQRLNQIEIQALGQGEKDILGRLSQIAQTAQSGTLTPENAAFMRNFIQATLEGARLNREAIEDDYVGNAARTHYMEPENVSKLVLGHPLNATVRKQREAQKGQGLLTQGPPAPTASPTLTPSAGLLESGPYSPDVISYARKYKISPADAARIKAQRTGGGR